MMAYNLASLAVAGGAGFAGAARNVYLEHLEGQREIEGQRLFFYREAGQRLGNR